MPAENKKRANICLSHILQPPIFSLGTFWSRGGSYASTHHQWMNVLPMKLSIPFFSHCKPLTVYKMLWQQFPKIWYPWYKGHPILGFYYNILLVIYYPTNIIVVFLAFSYKPRACSFSDSKYCRFGKWAVNPEYATTPVYFPESFLVQKTTYMKLLV